MKKKTEQILTVMNVLCWIAFFGLIVKAGAIIISYAVSVANPVAASDLYEGWNLHPLREFNFWLYTSVVSFMVALLILEAVIAFLVIKVLAKIKLDHPFTLEVSALLERIGYFTLGTWVTAVLYNAHTKWLGKKVAGMEAELVSVEFIFLAGVVFVISQVFKKGVAIQSENELTV